MTGLERHREAIRGYVIEACGDYIFVFDDKSGELLNTIDIT